MATAAPNVLVLQMELSFLVELAPLKAVQGQNQVEKGFTDQDRLTEIQRKKKTPRVKAQGATQKSAKTKRGTLRNPVILPFHVMVTDAATLAQIVPARPMGHSHLEGIVLRRAALLPRCPERADQF